MKKSLLSLTFLFAFIMVGQGWASHAAPQEEIDEVKIVSKEEFFSTRGHLMLRNKTKEDITIEAFEAPGGTIEKQSHPLGTLIKPEEIFDIQFVYKDAYTLKGKDVEWLDLTGEVKVKKVSDNTHSITWIYNPNSFKIAIDSEENSFFSVMPFGSVQGTLFYIRCFLLEKKYG